MFSHVHFPQKLAPEDLDVYLAAGWFRMAQSIFTTNFLNFKGQFYSAIWLRVALEKFTADKNQQKLIKRNSAFRTEIQPAKVTLAQEALFATYRASVSFEAATSLNSLLYGKVFYAIYDTYEVNIYDGDRLIASGFFDLGRNGAAGITSFYDPEYRKYSLGRYLIYLKMAYCRQHGFEYFYPGYFVPGYALFDYKLDMNRDLLQFLPVSTGQWAPIELFSPVVNPLLVMRQKLEAIQEELQLADIAMTLYQYEFFDGNLIPELSDIDLFDFPIFLKGVDPALGELGPWIVYDVRDDQYHIFQCTIIGTPAMPAQTAGNYTDHLVKVDHDIATAPNAEGIVPIIKAQRA